MTHTGLAAHGVHALPLLLVAGLLGGRLLEALPAWAGAHRDRRRQSTAAVLLLAAGVVHAVAASVHDGPVRVAMLGAAALQVLSAWAVLTRPTRAVLRSVVVLTAGVLLAWWVSRTVGLPLEGREPVGWLDALAGVAELAVLLLCRSGAAWQGRRVGAESLAWALIVTATAVAVAAPG